MLGGSVQFVWLPVPNWLAFSTHLRQFDDARRQRLGRRRLFGRMAEGIAGQPRKAAGPALAQRRELEHAPDRLALALRG